MQRRQLKNRRLKKRLKGLLYYSDRLLKRPLQDYYQLQLDLLRLTVVFGAIIFPCVWFAYSPNTALNYLLGAVTGIVYLRMLAKSVGKIGREAPPNSGGANSGRLAILIGVLVVATQLGAAISTASFSRLSNL